MKAERLKKWMEIFEVTDLTEIKNSPRFLELRKDYSNALSGYSFDHNGLMILVFKDVMLHLDTNFVVYQSRMIFDIK